ncbi:MAG: serine/threonine-protein kinase, partial [Planctomycetia bacterium]|nr:serine/threonine-protein kinase [Planctomycetia bacterium]
MSKLSVEDFLDYLRRSELTDESRLNSTLGEIVRSNAPEKYQDADFVASELVRYKLITNWHVRQLMKKKYKGFYLRQYRILGHLGSGGMSTVYLAEHTIMQRRVAIKVLPKKRLSNNVYLDRFIREAQASASLDHPNIVRAYDIDRSDDIHYIVMEYFEGTNLRQLVEKEGPLPFEDAVNNIRQGAEGLIHAHRIGVIHRDIKPENILVNDKGIAKILDLGLALLDETIFNQPLSSINEDKILGTADYLAPEQALDSHNIDARADIYSLGCTLYYCLTGHAPFPFGTISQRLLAHQKETPSSIFKDRPDAPQDLVEICSKMMNKKPEQRFQSATEVVRTMERWLVQHGFAEINDFPALAHLVEHETIKSDSSDNELFSKTFSYLSNSENATEHGSNRSFQFNGDFHSGIGNEDVVNLFGSETGITGSRSFSGSHSSLGFGSNSSPPEEIMLSKNAFLSPRNSSLDPLILAMNEIETEIIESSEKFAQSQRKTDSVQNPDPVKKRTDSVQNPDPAKKRTDSVQNPS